MYTISASGIDIEFIKSDVLVSNIGSNVNEKVSKATT